jgi:hypothetical protein
MERVRCSTALRCTFHLYFITHQIRPKAIRPNTAGYPAETNYSLIREKHFDEGRVQGLTGYEGMVRAKVAGA